MEDPTTLALNLTFFGTLGLALLMFLGLGFLMVVTLVLAGVAKLLSIIVLAMVGIFPKRDTVPVVHLPPRPRRVPALAESKEPTTAEADSLGTGAVVPEKPRLGVLGTTKLVWSAGWTAFRNFPWKSLVNPRTWPKPAQIKAGIAATATAVATTQAKEHPFVVAVKQDPPVLNSQWAAAVAEADARAAAREAEQVKEATAPEATPRATATLAREHQGDAHGRKTVSSGRVTASAGARPHA
ncbi:hypothetical protein [Arthrobacter sp. AZCC_0090]|uniref:hypothetical protein n=1 Tax=Arthrobacter sp. AZCC_0090 TaxID=2735881 RepID=UPI0016206923|nr:hypothetical protein [Arthrobacter sp. AZCC_0090]MBB6406755.1 hypothetical protein [Arthrobacter sp. AZCC_0090]